MIDGAERETREETAFHSSPDYFFNCSGWFLPQYRHQRFQI